MNKTIKIKATMDERWIDDFCSMLKYMEHCGNIGHTAYVGFCSDGDGDFRPEFKINKNFEIKTGLKKTDYEDDRLPEVETVFDAG